MRDTRPGECIVVTQGKNTVAVFSSREAMRAWLSDGRSSVMYRATVAPLDPKK